MIDNKFFDIFNESLKMVASYCPSCNSQYKPIEAKVIEESNDMHLLHIQCRNCAVSILALVMINSMGASSVGLVSDLSSQEVSKFKNTPVISIDDVIDIHQLLATKQHAVVDEFI